MRKQKNTDKWIARRGVKLSGTVGAQQEMGLRIDRASARGDVVWRGHFEETNDGMERKKEGGEW